MTACVRTDRRGLDISVPPKFAPIFCTSEMANSIVCGPFFKDYPFKLEKVLPKDTILK